MIYINLLISEKAYQKLTTRNATMDEDNFIKQQIGLRVKKYEYRDRFAARYLKQYSKASFHSFLILKLISKVRHAMLVLHLTKHLGMFFIKLIS